MKFYHQRKYNALGVCQELWKVEASVVRNERANTNVPHAIVFTSDVLRIATRDALIVRDGYMYGYATSC